MKPVKISSKLKRAREEDALLVVSGKQCAAFYRIRDGEISRLGAFKIPRPKYSDNEGRMAVRGKGMIVSVGGTRERQNVEVLKEFVHELKERTKKMEESFPSLYLFVPSPHKNEVRKALPKAWQDKLELEVEGNYYYRHPTFLASKIEQALENKERKE